MQSIDSTHYLTLYGNRGEVWERDNSGYATDSAMLVDWSDPEMFTYIHADSLFSKQLPHRIYILLPKDSVYAVEKEIKNQSLTHIGVDDFSFRRGVDFGTIICDLKMHRSVEILASRFHSTI